MVSDIDMGTMRQYNALGVGGVKEERIKWIEWVKGCTNDIYSFRKDHWFLPKITN